MFEIGFSELLLIFVIALIVLGPQKLPKLVAQVGRWAGKARGMARQFREQLESEINLDELNKAQAKTPPPPSPSNPWDPAPAEPVATAEPSTAAEPGVAPDSAVASDDPAPATSADAPPVASAAAEGASPYANPWDAPAVAPEPPPATEPSILPPTATHPAVNHERQA
jgi:sec-independent protein translocase protein TatB